MNPTRPRPRNYRLELHFRLALQGVPVHQRTWIRRDGRRARTFHELDPATDHWRHP